jgi:hypothetical protein
MSNVDAGRDLSDRDNRVRKRPDGRRVLPYARLGQWERVRLACVTHRSSSTFRLRALGCSRRAVLAYE